MVSIVGAGPGDPELITLKGKRKLLEADIVIYTGSLVSSAHLEGLKADCQVFNSAQMCLEEVISVIENGEKQGKQIVRLHTGDPCLYGAIREQMDIFRQKGIPFCYVPGVSSFCAAASVLEEEYTLPDVTQTVILTRMGGKTAVPEKESLHKLASHGASVVLFLSAEKIREAAEELLTGYEKTTPAAVVYKATWPEEIVLRGTLETIADLAEKAGIRNTALIIVSPALTGGSDYSLSKLYDSTFATAFREKKV